MPSEIQSFFDPKPKLSPFNQTGRSVIAVFYFDIDDRQLRTEDQMVMTLLIAHLKAELLKGKVEIAIVGNADHRGDTKYNKDLALDRAKTIEKKLGLALALEQNYSHIRTVSLGEAKARQDTSNAGRLARDRSVYIYTSSHELGHIEAPPASPREPVWRVTDMQWVIVDADVATGKPSFDGMLTGIIGGKIEGWILDSLRPLDPLKPGAERRWKRKLAKFDPSHRVTSMMVMKTEKTTSVHGITINSIVTDVKYKWGIPIVDYIIVHFSEVSRSEDFFGFSGKKSVIPKNSILKFDRLKSERNPFFFPDSTWRPKSVR